MDGRPNEPTRPRSSLSTIRTKAALSLPQWDRSQDRGRCFLARVTRYRVWNPSLRGSAKMAICKSIVALAFCSVSYPSLAQMSGGDLYNDCESGNAAKLLSCVSYLN